MFKLFRRSLPLAILLTAGMAISGVRAAGGTSDLTGGIWAVCGLDGHSSWHETTLVFTAQFRKGNAEELEGYFDWKSSNGSYGRELFRGRLSADGRISLVGYRLENAYRIINSRYTAMLAKSGETIVDGHWLDGLPGTWGAVKGGTSSAAAALCEAQSV